MSRPTPVLVAAIAAAAAVAQAPGATLAADHNDPIGVQANYVSGDNAAYGVDTNDPAADIADVFAWYTADKQNVAFALTWRVDPTEEKEKSFDPSVEYGIHVDTADKKLLDVKLDGDGLSLGSKLHTEAAEGNDRGEYTKGIHIIGWFGPHKDNAELKKKGQPEKWGVLVSGVPGVSKPIVGSVGTIIEKDGVKVAAGLFDDAFFADLDGFFNSVSVALGNNPGSNPSLPPQLIAKSGRYDPRDRAGSAPQEKSGIRRPLGYPEKPVDGFGKQNVHALVVEVPADRFPARKLHVWSTTQRVKRLDKKSGTTLACSYDATKQRLGEGETHCTSGEEGSK